MTAPTAEERAWTPGRWIVVAGGIMAAQVLLIVLLSDRTSVLPRHPRSSLRIALLGAPGADSRLNSLAIPTDPTLFALANQREFTGAAWKRPQPTGPRLPDWIDQGPSETPPLPTGLGSAPVDYLRAHRVPSLAALGRVPTSMGGLASRPMAVRTQSLVSVEGVLAERPLLAPLKAPSWPHQDLLTNTVVDLTVNQAGFAVSASTRQSSGLATADRKALEIARAARFQTGPSDRLDQGSLVIAWHTLAPTNAPPAPAP